MGHGRVVWHTASASTVTVNIPPKSGLFVGKNAYTEVIVQYNHTRGFSSLFGTDTVAPSGPAPYYAVFDMWAPVFRQLTSEASLKIRKGNYERLFDTARLKVRAWERTNIPRQ